MIVSPRKGRALKLLRDSAIGLVLTAQLTFVVPAIFPDGRAEASGNNVTAQVVPALEPITPVSACSTRVNHCLPEARPQTVGFPSPGRAETRGCRHPTSPAEGPGKQAHLPARKAPPGHR